MGSWRIWFPWEEEPKGFQTIRDGKQLGKLRGGGGAHEPILSSMEMSGWILESQGIWEIAQVYLETHEEAVLEQRELSVEQS